MTMRLCALKIGEHVWKVVSRERRGNIIIERVPRYKADQATQTFSLDQDNDCCLVFCYIRTNQNDMDEYGFIDSGRMVKAHEGIGKEEGETREETQETVHLHEVSGAA